MSESQQPQTSQLAGAKLALRSAQLERDIMRQTGHKREAMVRRYIWEAGLFEHNAAEGLL